MRKNLILPALIFLIVIEILSVYFIMPFPGSQKNETLDFAYWLHNNIWWLRIIGIAVAMFSLIGNRSATRKRRKIFLISGVLLYAVIFFFVNFRLMADKMFYQPTQILFAGAKENKIAQEKLVLGIYLNGEAKAYPIQLIGYHHQVRDSLAGRPVMVTYCTVCRTGRVYEPLINGEPENFRLVGMDRFNAMFEDATTKSWWQQVSGAAVAGPLKGASLKEIPASQLSLAAWLRQYPNSLILQEDPEFREDYERLVGFDKGQGASSLTARDTGSWKPKSWIIGVSTAQFSKAYDWNELVKKRLIQDTLTSMPLVIVLENDSSSFHVWSSIIDGQRLTFNDSMVGNNLQDLNTGSLWNMDGLCIEGSLAGRKLQRVSASQEFWHSWQTFNPGTSVMR